MSDKWSEIVHRTLEADRVEGPHAWIQWKGTQVCMDVYCPCGHGIGHVDDAEFAYDYECPGCGKVYSVGANVRLHELTPDEAEYVKSEGLCLIGPDYMKPAGAEEARLRGLMRRLVESARKGQVPSPTGHYPAPFVGDWAGCWFCGEEGACKADCAWRAIEAEAVR